MYLCTLLYILFYFYQFISSNEKVSCSMCFVGGGGVTCSFFVTDNKKRQMLSDIIMAQFLQWNKLNKKKKLDG